MKATTYSWATPGGTAIELTMTHHTAPTTAEETAYADGYNVRTGTTMHWTRPEYAVTVAGKAATKRATYHAHHNTYKAAALTWLVGRRNMAVVVPEEIAEQIATADAPRQAWESERAKAMEAALTARQAAEDRRAAQRKAMLDGGWM
jgi:hypothetical protein